MHLSSRKAATRVRPRQEGARKAARDKIYASVTGPPIRYKKNTIPLARPPNMKNNNPSAFFFLEKKLPSGPMKEILLVKTEKIVYGEYLKGSC